MGNDETKEQVPERAPRHRRLPSPEDYEQEAVPLEARALHIERQMWALSEEVARATARHQSLRGLASPTTAEAKEMRELGHTIGRLVREISQARGEYVTLLRQAQQRREVAAAQRPVIGGPGTHTGA